MLLAIFDMGLQSRVVLAPPGEIDEVDVGPLSNFYRPLLGVDVQGSLGFSLPSFTSTACYATFAASYIVHPGFGPLSRHIVRGLMRLPMRSVVECLAANASRVLSEMPPCVGGVPWRLLLAHGAEIN